MPRSCSHGPRATSRSPWAGWRRDRGRCGWTCRRHLLTMLRAGFAHRHAGLCRSGRLGGQRETPGDPERRHLGHPLPCALGPAFNCCLLDRDCSLGVSRSSAGAASCSPTAARCAPRDMLSALVQTRSALQDGGSSRSSAAIAGLAAAPHGHFTSWISRLILSLPLITSTSSWPSHRAARTAAGALLGAYLVMTSRSLFVEWIPLSPPRTRRAQGSPIAVALILVRPPAETLGCSCRTDSLPAPHQARRR